MKQETQTKQFEPLAVGIDSFGYKEALNAWNVYAEATTELNLQVINFLDIEELDVNTFFELPLNNPDKLIAHLFKMKGLAPEGLNITKMVSLGMIENVHAEDVIKYLAWYQESKIKAEKLFRFDLKELFDNDGLFTISPEFKAKLKHRFTSWTKDEMENTMLKHLLQFTNEINWFIESGIVRVDRGVLGLQPLLKSLNVKEDRTGFKPWLNSISLLKYRLSQ